MAQLVNNPPAMRDSWVQSLGWEDPLEKGKATQRGFIGDVSGKEPACQCRRHETRVRSLGREDPLEERMATHSGVLA